MWQKLSHICHMTNPVAWWSLAVPHTTLLVTNSSNKQGLIYTLIIINNLRNSAIQSEEIIFILRMWQRGSLSEHNNSKSWRTASKSWCHECQVRFS